MFVIFGKFLYGEALYGENYKLGEDFGKQCKDLIKYIPRYYHDSEAIQEILKTEGCHIGYLEFLILDFAKQFLIETATWGLDYYEHDLGLTSNPSMTLERRREIIKAKLRGRGTTTKKMIQNTAEAFSGGEVEVEEINDKYTFIIKFVGTTGIPSNMEGFIDMLENIKPAHLKYILEYTYIVWGDLKKHNWKRLEGLTWGEIPEDGELVR